MPEVSEEVMKTKGDGPSRRAKWLAYAACGWAVLYAAYRAYYALGGTVGMFGTPVSMSQWRPINGVGAVIILIGAVPPVAAIPLWQCRQARLVLLALCWVVAVGCVMHALVNGTARILSLAGILHMDFPFFASIDRRESDLQDLLLNELNVGATQSCLGGGRIHPQRAMSRMRTMARRLGKRRINECYRKLAIVPGREEAS